MPSALASRKSLLDRRGLLSSVDLQARNVRAPWHGYTPTTDPTMLPSGSFVDVMGLIEQGGELGPDYGWLRFEDQSPDASPAPLPLGRNGAAVFDGVAPGAAIIRADLFVTHPGLVYENLALTNNNFIVNVPPNTQYNRLYRFGTTGEWEQVPTTALMTGTALIADSATYSPANRWIFCTTDDDVRAYNPAGNEHHVLLCSIANFKARSLCVHDERVLFLNTSEGGNPQPLRVRWTKRGWTTEATANFTDPGSGALDLIEFQTEGVSIRQIDTRVVIYTGDGVMFLDRTFSTTAPFRKQIVTRTRGLLGTHAVTDMGSGVHFGAFTDGFFLFDASGRFTECGVFRVGDDIHRKVADRFFSLLKWSARDRVLVHREPGPRGFVYIAFPTGTSYTVGSDTNAPDQVWVYDPRTDSFWPDSHNYFDRAFTVTSPMPTTFANYVEVTSTSPTWDTITGTWGSIVGSWGSYGQTTGHYRMVHGTWDGYLYQHEPGMVGRQMRGNTVVPVWWLETPPFGYGDSFRAKTLHRVGVEYRNSGSPQMVGVLAMDGLNPNTTLAFGTFTADRGSAGGSVTDYVTLQVRGEQLGTRLAGDHPTILRGWQEHFSVESAPFSKAP